jgi:hypothetical protein
MNRRARLLELLSQTEFPAAAPRLAIEIAGVRLDLLIADARLMARASAYFEAYRGEGPAVAELSLAPAFAEELWEDVDPEFRIEGPWVIQRDFAARRLTARASEACAERAVARLAPGIDDAFHNLLRWFLPPLLLRRGAFLLHGAGVVRDGRGYVFFGQSGAGKSTSVSLIVGSDPAAQVLGDDAVIVAVDAEGARWLHSAPLGSGYTREAPPALRAPLARLCALKQDERVASETLAISEAMAALLASAMSVGHGDALEERLDLAERFAREGSRVERLSFTKDPEFWNTIREARDGE